MKQYDQTGSHLFTHGNKTFLVDIYEDSKPEESTHEGMMRVRCHETDKVIIKPYYSRPLYFAKKLIEEASWGLTGQEFVAELKKHLATGGAANE